MLELEAGEQDSAPDCGEIVLVGTADALDEAVDAEALQET